MTDNDTLPETSGTVAVAVKDARESIGIEAKQRVVDLTCGGSSRFQLK
jgi:hypothetical protein